MPQAPLSLLGYVSRQFSGDQEQKFDFMTVAGEKVTGNFAASPEPDDHVVVVLTANDRLHVIVVGGRIAGAATAMLRARGGMRVLCLEASLL